MLNFLNDVLSDATLVALAALTGTIFSNVTQRKNARDQEQISILDITVRSLSERVTALETSLAAAASSQSRKNKHLNTHQYCICDCLKNLTRVFGIYSGITFLIV